MNDLDAILIQLTKGVSEEAKRAQKNKPLIKREREKEKKLQKAWFQEEHFKELKKIIFSIFLSLIILFTFVFNWLLIFWQGIKTVIVPNPFNMPWYNLGSFDIPKDVITTYTQVSLVQGVILIQQLASISGNETFLDKIGNILEKLFNKNDN